MTSMTTHARRATPDADADAVADGTDLRLVVTGGVDTHGQTHHAAVLDHLGRQIADEQFLANPVGYRQMLAWLRSHGELGQVGVEGTGAYGAALARHLSAAGVTVIEVDRPDRRSRRAVGKSDPLDAYSAARAVLSGQANGTPKTRNGQVEAIRVLRVARRSALKARTQAMNQLRALLVTGPAELREQMRPLNTKNLIASCARLRPTAGPGVPLDPEQAVKTALRHLSRRHQHLSQEINDTDRDLHALLTAAAPRLLALKGVGTDVAGALVVSTGDNPHRLRNEAAFAHLAGVAPLPASSGRTDRHRLNRGGDRSANNALHTIALVRLSCDPRTRTYAERRRAQGLSNKDVMRCLKRYIAREVFTAITTRPQPLDRA